MPKLTTSLSNVSDQALRNYAALLVDKVIAQMISPDEFENAMAQVEYEAIARRSDLSEEDQNNLALDYCWLESSDGLLL